MVNKHQTYSVTVRKLFKPCDNLIIICVTVIIAAHFTHLLKSIYDNQFCIGVFRHKSCKLFVKSIPKLTCRKREVQIIRTFCSEHPIQSFLQSVIIIFESKIQNCSFSHIIIPKRCACTDVICKLCHKKTFAKFRCSCKDICARIKQAFNQRRFTLIHRVIQLTHRNGFQM